jgi:hypothetical protein
MKKTLIFLLALVVSFNCLADCRPQIESVLIKKITSQKKLARAGKIVTGSAFVTVGGFYGTMGVILLGPLWAGAVVGSTFGAVAALPVGATFIIINKAKKDRIKNLGRTLSIIGGGEELGRLYNKLLATHPDLTEIELIAEIEDLNNSQALCDGTVSGKKRTIALPKEIYRFLDAKLSVMNSRISLAEPSNTI